MCYLFFLPLSASSHRISILYNLKWAYTFIVGGRGGDGSKIIETKPYISQQQCMMQLEIVINQSGRQQQSSDLSLEISFQ